MITMNIQVLLIPLLKPKIGILKISICLPNKQNDRFHFRHKNQKLGTILSEIAAFPIAKNSFHPRSVLVVGFSLSVGLADPLPLVNYFLDERFNDFETAFKFDKTQEFVDVSFKYSRERLHELVISANFSSYLCQLACGTNTGSLQLYCPTRPSKPLIERRRPNELRNRSNNTHIRFPGI